MVRCLFDFMSNGGGVGDDPAAALSVAKRQATGPPPFPRRGAATSGVFII